MNHTNDRLLKFERMEDGKQYKGYLLEIPLHAIYDYNLNLWKMRYNPPAKLPPMLQDRLFTKFEHLRKYAEEYFAKRNMKLKEIIDIEE